MIRCSCQGFIPETLEEYEKRYTFPSQCFCSKGEPQFLRFASGVSASQDGAIYFGSKGTQNSARLFGQLSEESQNLFRSGLVLNFCCLAEESGPDEAFVFRRDDGRGFAIPKGYMLVDEDTPEQERTSFDLLIFDIHHGVSGHVYYWRFFTMRTTIPRVLVWNGEIPK